MGDELLSLFYPLSEDEKLAKNNLLPPEKQFDLTDAPQTLQRDGKLITVSQHGRFVRTPLHRHGFIEMEYVLSGSVAQRIEENRVVLQQGDLLIMNRNVYHTVEVCGQDDILINIMVLPEYFDRVLTLSGTEDSPMRRFFLSCILDTDHTPDYLLFNIKDILPVRHLIENMIWSIKNDIPYKQTTNQLTMALLLRLLQYHGDRVRSDTPEYGLIWEVQRYIDRNYRDGCLEEAARQLHYDYRWLSHEVVRKTGKTFTALMQERRLQQAVYLLKNTDYSVTEIGNMVGYTNLTYYYRLFHETFGCTPKQYREAKRASQAE